VIARQDHAIYPQRKQRPLVSDLLVAKRCLTEYTVLLDRDRV
jgi:hypothetical protein